MSMYYITLVCFNKSGHITLKALSEIKFYPFEVVAIHKFRSVKIIYVC